jgi:copper(I)-binding protein
MFKNSLRHVLVLAVASMGSAAALAQVSVSDPWIRATVPAQKTTGAFMQLRSPTPTRLVSAASPAAGRVEIHQMEMQGQTMRMHAVDGIALAAGQPLNLASGGYHIMLFDLKRQLKDGEQVPLELRFVGPDGKPANVIVQVPVKPLTYAVPAAAAH